MPKKRTCEKLSDTALLQKNKEKRSEFLSSIDLKDLRCIGDKFSVKARSRKELTSKINKYIERMYSISKMGKYTSSK